MKKHLLYSVFALCGLTALATACSDYLDKAPEADGYTEEAVFADSTNYNLFADYLVSNLIVHHLQAGVSPLGSFDCGVSDNSISCAIYTSVPSVRAVAGDYVALRNNGDAVMCNNTTWERLWKHIRKANLCIDHIETYPGDEASRNEILGISYFFRGFCYMELCRRWGGMPYLYDAIMDASADMDFPRLGMQETYIKAAADLDSAAMYLPAVQPDELYHHPSATAALALKSRCYLYAASDQARLEEGGGQNLWEKAAQVTDEAIRAAEAAGYSLVPMKDYYYIFKGGKDEVFKQEMLFARRAQIAWGSDAYRKTIRPAGVLNGIYCACPNQLLVDCFEMQASGLPISDPASGYNPQDPYKGRDPRFYENIIYNGAKIMNRELQIWHYDETTGKLGSKDCLINSGSDVQQSYTQTGYYANKWMGNTWNTQLKQQWPEIRLAELYLNYAEAANEAWGNPAQKNGGQAYSALEALNVVRNRAQMPDLDPKFHGSEAFRQRVRNERRIEFAFEEHRTFDVRRWGIGKEPENRDIWRMYITKVKKSTEYPTGFKYQPEFFKNRIFEDRHNLFVIKLDDTYIGPNFKQNPGW